jgi:hypothetical protein
MPLLLRVGFSRNASRLPSFESQVLHESANRCRAPFDAGNLLQLHRSLFDSARRVFAPILAHQRIKGCQFVVRVNDSPERQPLDAAGLESDKRIGNRIPTDAENFGYLAVGDKMSRKENNFRASLHGWTRMMKSHRLQFINLLWGWGDDMQGGLLPKTGFQLHSNIQPFHYQ